MDWYDLRVPGRMRAHMVEPRHPDNILGELTGVKWDECSITWGYELDVRTTAKLVLQDGNWDGRAWIRLTYETGDYKAALGTYIVKDDRKTDKHRRVRQELSLYSVLKALAEYKHHAKIVVTKGSYCSTLLKKMFEYIGYQYSLSGLKEFRAERQYLLTIGDDMNYLNWLFKICNETGNRIDVTGTGTITVSKKRAPGEIPQVLELDVSDERGMIADGITVKSNYLTVPGRVVVHHQVGSGKSATDIVAYADADGKASYAYRGYLPVKFVSVSDMSPETYQQALKLAQEYLSGASASETEHSMTVPFLPICEGSGVTYWPRDAATMGKRTCFVTEINMTNLHLNRPDMRITLRECT